jgi:hypothetical protein
MLVFPVHADEEPEVDEEFPETILEKSSVNK